MARGVTSPASATAPAHALPQVSFVKVQSDSSTAPFGTHDHQARSYGYNDFSEFRRPEHYIRHIEPLESELAIQVEYDMDEQDQEWLDGLNAERKKDQLNPVSYEVFEIIVDRLEKEWFDLTKNIPKHDFAMPSEDSTCAICDDSEGENTNAIVFCDGCNLAVHQECYGVPYIPEGQWLCRKCTVSPEIPVSCMLCPNEGGAFKQTVTGEWVHLLCAIWVPETRVANEVFMEPITGVERISKQRWKLKCSICEIREGACIQCARTSCFLAFHATCARRQKLLMPMKSPQGTEPVALTSYCEKHLPPEQQKIRKAAVESGQLDDDVGAGGKLSKSARAYARTYKPGPPLVPNIIVERIMQYIAKVIIRKKTDFVLLMCKYWSLKREARRGAPLLKRLHLEPWTASTGSKQQTEQEKVMKLKFLKWLRQDLQSVRNLTELSRKRESRKLWQAGIMHDILSCFLFSHEMELRQALEKITSLDRLEYFKHPVSRAEVPDYFDVIKNPICWEDVEGKLARHEYWDVHLFKRDVDLVLNNAMTYNQPGTAFYKTASRIQAASKPILDELDKLSRPSAFRPAEENLDLASTDSNIEPLVGDLEPPLNILELLLSADAIKDDLELILEEGPMASLLNHELAKVKPRPSPPPRPPKKSPKSKKDVKLGQKSREVFREAAERRKTRVATQAALDTSPGFRAPRTRQALTRAAQAEPKEAAHGANITPGSLPAEGPRVVDDVNNRQSFNLFDKGWILPADTKRGGRGPVDRTPLPPSKKRAKTDVQAEAENELQTSADRLPKRKFTDATDVLARTSAVDLTDHALSNVIEQANGTVIIETLDTPAIRRAKARRRKAERNTQLMVAAPASVQQPTSSPVASSSRLPAEEADADMESELTSLSGSELQNERNGDQGEAAEHIGSIKVLQEHKGQDSTNAEGPTSNANDAWVPLEGGTLVWAKAESFPWWPAVVFEEDDEDIPDAVLEAKAPRRGYQGPLQLVRFYDRKSSWQWVGTDRLLMLGNKAFDKDLLSNNSKKQKWKSQGIRHECSQAYERALAEMEIEESEGTQVPGEGGSAPSAASGDTIPSAHSGAAGHNVNDARGEATEAEPS